MYYDGVLGCEMVPIYRDNLDNPEGRRKESTKMNHSDMRPEHVDYWPKTDSNKTQAILGRISDKQTIAEGVLKTLSILKWQQAAVVIMVTNFVVTSK